MALQIGAKSLRRQPESRRIASPTEKDSSMFDKYMVLTREFQNVLDNGQIIGFQLKVRITYYRGVYLALIGGFEVTVDGEKFRPEQMRFSIAGRTYTMEELAKAETIRWPFGDEATLTILKPGGLKPGIHDVLVVQAIKPSYHPPGFVGKSHRKITLVA
jgi:hypothetical protein